LVGRGAGHDNLRGRDRFADVVDGGPGRDRAAANPRLDTVRDAELAG
jgi:hypothetical protein